jgi:uncharacterized protein (TIGR02001 family)
MKKPLLALAFVSAVSAIPTVALADGPSISYNIGAVTEYRYRGISQSGLDPALQGGVDYSNPSGVYLGTWASTIKWIKDGGTIAGVDAGDTPLEWDLYGGYKGSINKDLSYDVGGLAYVYLNNKYGNIPGAADANTFEIYGALSFGPATAKYSYALTNLFGFSDSKGSGYFDLSATFDLGNGWSVVPHIGYQDIRHNSSFSYTDYSLTLNKDLGKGFSVSAAAVGADTKDIAGNPGNYAYFSPSGKNLARGTIVLGVKYSF